MPKMYYYRNPALMRLPQSLIFTPIGGVFFDDPLTNFAFVSPEIVYVQRGTDMTYNHRTNHRSMQEHYSISTSYIDLRLPLELGWKIKPWFQPYVSVGVEAGLCLFGKIQLDRQYYTALFPHSQKPLSQPPDRITIPVDSANMSMIHVGAFAGMGVRSKLTIVGQDYLLKLNVSFHQGFVDSYSPDEHDGSAQAANVHAYKVTGVRWPLGLEVTLGVAIPIENGFYDACSSFSKDRYRRHGRRGHVFGF